jgi:hypothetical protein
MKKIFAFAATALFAATSFAQKEVDFKIDYKPNTTYTSSTSQKGNVTLTFGGSEETLGMLEAQGVENPTITPIENDNKSIVKTGKATGTTIPFITETIVDPKSPTAAALPNGAKIYGKKAAGQPPVFDSISAPGAKKEVRDIIFSTIKGSVAQLFVPATKVKVGESFTKDIPLKFPAGMMGELEMNSNVTYMLKKIEAGKAYFDTKTIYTIDTEIQGQEVKGSGTGAGSFIYDIANGYNVQQNEDMTMEMNMSMQGMDMKIGTASKSETKTVITANK